MFLEEWKRELILNGKSLKDRVEIMVNIATIAVSLHSASASGKICPTPRPGPLTLLFIFPPWLIWVNLDGDLLQLKLTSFH